MLAKSLKNFNDSDKLSEGHYLSECREDYGCYNYLVYDVSLLR